MAITTVELKGKKYRIPTHTMCPKDSMIATLSTRTMEYECCDCSWTMSTREYIEKNAIEPDMEDENSIG
ncbi:MAG: hypothetical protein IJZ62_05800 [Clostridia bacterium]|nr:hypothetical protein [Clostridia bacterium]